MKNIALDDIVFETLKNYKKEHNLKSYNSALNIILKERRLIKVEFKESRSKIKESINKKKVKVKNQKGNNIVEITFEPKILKQLEKMKGNRSWEEFVTNLSLIRINGNTI